MIEDSCTVVRSYALLEFPTGRMVGMTQHYLHVQERIRQEAIRKFSAVFHCDDDPNPTNIIIFPKQGHAG